MNKDISMSHYPMPDFSVVRACLDKFNVVVASREYSFIPSLQERLTLASKLLNQDTRAIVDHVRSLEVLAESSDVTDILEQWTQITTSSLDSHVKTPALSTLTNLYVKRLNRMVNEVRAAKEEIDRKIAEGAGLNLEHYSDPLLAYDAVKLAELEQQDIALASEEVQLLEDKQALKAALKVLQSKSWLDHIKELLPTAQQIETLVAAAVVAKVDAQVVTIALERITLYLDVFNDGLKLSSMIEARNKVTDQLTALQRLKHENADKVQLLKAREAKIKRHSELVEARTLWVNNMTLVNDGLEMFVSGISSTNEPTELAMQHYTTHLAEFKTYLQKMSR
ncbi:alpha-xenorhabdolysin family binary toxin subunit B [Pseudomonas psychrophila]|uniref:alpha-xenorhabdolysin family binary toxin subunit B n=1 Tax=Pseudomonas psychrophila TaxID=122355 RepID=UPI0002F1A88D|nr:alpha-xenorhabdolysin family binary toxin subunit B [Pseudomonas psychrophila]